MDLELNISEWRRNQKRSLDASPQNIMRLWAKNMTFAPARQKIFFGVLHEFSLILFCCHLLSSVHCHLSVITLFIGIFLFKVG
jgi:uncharacterized membrane protein